MLPKKNRLVNQKDISFVLKSRDRAFFGGVQVVFGKNRAGGFRNLIVISKKIHKRAVVRNYIRRQFNAIFEDLKFKNFLTEGVDCLILTKEKTLKDERITEKYYQFLEKQIKKRTNQNPKV
jgi:ribonuclease P protein component